MEYRPEIDGLRAVAVVPVILFHAGFGLFSGGYVGVDVFFVISGFLITSILMKDLDRGEFSIVKFYQKRIRRLLPALFLVVFCSLVAGWLILMPAEFQDFFESVIAVIFCSSNFLFWQESSYWDTSSELKPLLHTWSLAVEEQYYLIFPPFLYITYRKSKKLTFWIISLVFLCSLFGAHFISDQLPTANFYLLPSRAWEMMLGSIGAFALSNEKISNLIKKHKLSKEVMSVIGITMILYAIFCYDHHTPNPSLWTLIPALGALLVILYCDKNTLVGKLLSLKPMLLIGLISYSAYLWHQPIFAYARYVAFPEQNQFLFVMLSIAVFPISYLTWKYIENPFRRESLVSNVFVFKGAAIISVLFVFISSIGIWAKGFDSRGSYQELLILSYEPNNKKLSRQSREKLRKQSNDPDYGNHQNSYDHELWFDLNDDRNKLLVVGNSHSLDMYNTLLNSDSCSRRFELARYGDAVRNFMNDGGLMSSANYRHADYILICSRYSRECSASLISTIRKFNKDGKIVAVVRNVDEFEEFGTSTYTDKIYERKAKLISSGELSVEEFVKSVNKEHYKLMHNKKPEAFIMHSNKVIDEIEKANLAVVLDRTDYSVDVGNSEFYIIDHDLNKFYFDGDHYTIQGAKFYGKRIDEIKWLDELLGIEVGNDVRNN